MRSAHTQTIGAHRARKAFAANIPTLWTENRDGHVDLVRPWSRDSHAGDGGDTAVQIFTSSHHVLY